VEKVEKAIRQFHERVTEIERITDLLNSALMMAPESGLNAAIWALIGGYKDALGDAYFIDEWLEWWWMECNLGAKTMQAGLLGEEMRTIATLEDFIRLVCDDLARSENECAK